MSTTVCLPPIVAALLKAENILGPDRVWKSENATQARFLRDFFKEMRKGVFQLPEIEAIASWKAEDINSFLRKRGFSIQLEEFGADTFGVAATLILLLKWAVEGSREVFKAADGLLYDGVRMGKGVVYFTSPSHPNPIAMIETQSGDEVYLSIMDNPPAGFDMVNYVANLSPLQSCWQFGDLVFPMVDLDQLVDIRWLIGMRTTAQSGQEAWISQAMQQTIFRMNEIGALLKSAVAVAVTIEMVCSSGLPDLVIDRPFLVWIVRKGLSVPLLVAHITQENWMDPGDLSQ